MTVESAKNKSGPFNVTGTSGTFPRDFLIRDPSHLRVIRVRNGVETDLLTGITHTGMGTPSGNVTVTAGIASGDKVYLLRSVPHLQRTDYSNQGKVHPEVIEGDLDLQTMQMQDLAEERARTLKVGVSSELSGEDALLFVLKAPEYAAQSAAYRDQAAMWAAAAAQAPAIDPANVRVQGVMPDNTVLLQTILDAGDAFFPMGEYALAGTMRPRQGAAPRNIAPYSEDFTSFFETMWTLNSGITKGVTVERNVSMVPMRQWGAPADRMREAANDASHRIEWLTGDILTPGASYAASIYVKVTGSRQFAIQWVGSDGQSLTARFDPATGEVVSISAGATAAVTVEGGGWYRFRMAFTPTAAGGEFRLWLYSGGFTYTGSTAVYADLFGFQLNLGTIAGDYQKTPVILPRFTGQRIEGQAGFRSKLSTNNSTILNIRNATGLTVEKMGFTHNIETGALRAEAGVIDETVSVVNTTSIYPSADVTLRNNLWHNVSGTCIDIYGAGSERWQVIGNRALEIGLAFLYASVKSQDHIVALNHILNPGDATIVFNGPSRNNLALGNHIRFRGERHVLSGGTGGHAFVTQGKYNLYAGNMIADCGGTFVQVMTGKDGTANTTADGNLYTGNVFDGLQLRQEQQDSFGQFILRPQNGALNVFSDNMIRGASYLDLVHSRSPSHGATDTGGDWVFRDIDARDMRYLWYVAGNGRSITFKGCTFRGVAGAALIQFALSGISWDELVIEDCLIDCGPRNLAALIRLTQDTQTIKRIVFRRNRVVANSIADLIVATTGALANIQEIIWEDNDLPAGAYLSAGAAAKSPKPLRLWGSGSPEGVVPAPPGSTYMRRDGGAGSSLYVKEANNTAAGWVAK